MGNESTDTQVGLVRDPCMHGAKENGWELQNNGSSHQVAHHVEGGDHMASCFSSPCRFVRCRKARCRHADRRA
jgi:hypothetical protein